MRKRSGRPREEQKPAAGAYSKCQICGNGEKYPVAIRVGRDIKWVCYRCWKERH